MSTATLGTNLSGSLELRHLLGDDRALLLASDHYLRQAHPNNQATITDAMSDWENRMIITDAITTIQPIWY